MSKSRYSPAALDLMHKVISHVMVLKATTLRITLLNNESRHSPLALDLLRDDITCSPPKKFFPTSDTRANCSFQSRCFWISLVKTTSFDFEARLRGETIYSDVIAHKAVLQDNVKHTGNINVCLGLYWKHIDVDRYHVKTYLDHWSTLHPHKKQLKDLLNFEKYRFCSPRE